MVAYYPFNNNYDDESQFNNHLTATGSPVFTANRNGVANSALLFDGVNDFLTVGNVDIPKGVRDRTVTLWFKNSNTDFAGSGSEKMGTLLDYGTFDTNKRFAIQMGGNNSVTGSGKISFNSIGYSLSSRKNFNDDKWHFLQVVYVGNYLNIYVDGRLEKGGRNELNTTFTEFNIGRTITNTLGLTQYFKGAIDDIKIYNKALNSIEIEQIYTQEAPPAPDLTSGLVAHYKFEDNFLDETENNNDGTQSGGVTFENGRNGAGKAAKFDGNGFITTPLLQNNVNEYTISTWVKTSQLSGDVALINSRAPEGTPCCNNSRSISMGIGSGKVSYALNSNFIAIGKSSQNNIVNNQWTLITGVLKAPINSNAIPNQFKIFVNGVLVQTTDVSYNPNNHNIQNPYSGLTTTVIGHWQNQYRFNGSLDDIRIYNRALTDEEVLQLYNQEKPAEAIDLASGLVAYYPFNGNANDASGNGNNGIVNGATLTSDRYGNFGANGKAYSFDGVNDRIEIPALNSSKFGNTFTISTWVQFDSFTNSNYPHLIGGQNNFIAFHGLGPAYSVNDRKKVGFYFDPRSNIYNQHTQSSTTLTQGQFYNVTASRSNSTLKIYINGILEHTVSNPNTMLSGNYIWMGMHPNIGSTAMNGKLDDIRIYNRALSDAEVLALYNQEKP